MARHWEFLSDAWFVSQIGPEEMGRTASKVETLEERLSALLSRAHLLHSRADRYFAPSSSPEKTGDPLLKQGADLHFKVSGDGMTTFKPVDASRLVFAGLPRFDPGPYLDERGRAIYEDPLSSRLPPEEYKGPKPKLRVHCSRSEKIKLFSLLDSTGRLRLHRSHEVTPQFGSGLFAVTKDLEKDRMILDSRGANLLERPPKRWIRRVLLPCSE